MGPEHLGTVVEIYRRSFQGTFLASLGPAILSLMFGAFLDGAPREISIVCLNSSDQAIGFVCGSGDRVLYVRNFLRKRIVTLLPLVVAAAARDKRLAVEIIRRSRSLLVALLPQPDASLGGLPPASLMTIAVADDSRGQGVGASLVVAFTDKLAQQGVPSVRLAVGKENRTARRLYERLGWSLSPAKLGSRHSAVCYYVKRLSAASS